MIFSFFQKKPKEEAPISSTIKPLVLVILDGFGIAPASPGNAITQAETPNIDSYYSRYPHGELIASGESVGLPANEVGNTEVGHLTLGAGRIILQDLKRIGKAIEDSRFLENRAFYDAALHVKKFSSKIHLMGLVGSGNVHSSLPHLFALLQFCKKENISDVFLHLFTDGRDSPPEEAISIIEKIQKYLKDLKFGQIATISGRYYAMDRDRRWDRTKKAYDAIVSGLGVTSSDPESSLKYFYDKKITDEFIEPTVIVSENARPKGCVADNDAIIFFNFRVDRPRQLTMAFTLENFENLKAFDFGYSPETGTVEGQVSFRSTFKREIWPKNLFFVTMTEYHKNIPVRAVAFPPEKIEDSLPMYISLKGLTQMHMAESEKERFVRYYFDGSKEELYPGEESSIVSSPRVKTYDKKPIMALDVLIAEFKIKLREDKFNFFVINFANCDMVAHTGRLKPTISAVEAVDKYLGEIVDEVLLRSGTVIVTADHGNAEELVSYPGSAFFYTSKTGSVNTDHSNNPVPLIIIKKDFEGQARKLAKGSLADVAPTILGLMGFPIPAAMTGRNLLTII